MLKRTLGASSNSEVFFRAFCAFAAVCVTLYIFNEALARYAIAHVWEPWVKSGSSFATFVPVMFMALLSGLVVGAALAAVFRLQAIRVAAAAALLQVVWAVAVWLSTEQPIGPLDFFFPLLLAVGLLVGAAFVGLARRS